MIDYRVQLNRLPDEGGATRGIYLPHKLAKQVLSELVARQAEGENKLSFAGLVQEMIEEHFSRPSYSNVV